MAEKQANVVSASSAGPKLPDGVIGIEALESTDPVSGCRVFTHYNGPTDELSGLAVGMCVLDPGSSPHPPHQHPEEEIMLVTEGAGEITVGGQTYAAAPGSMMYCGGQGMHGITAGPHGLTFYFYKWKV